MHFNARAGIIKELAYVAHQLSFFCQVHLKSESSGSMFLSPYTPQTHARHVVDH